MAESLEELRRVNFVRRLRLAGSLISGAAFDFEHGSDDEAKTRLFEAIQLLLVEVPESARAAEARETAGRG